MLQGQAPSNSSNSAVDALREVQLNVIMSESDSEAEPSQGASVAGLVSFLFFFLYLYLHAVFRPINQRSCWTGVSTKMQEVAPQWQAVVDPSSLLWSCHKPICFALALRSQV